MSMVSMAWLIWLVGGVALVTAGFAVTALPRWRARRLSRTLAWSMARSAIDSATVSRDASAREVTEAEQLLTRAELIAADHGGAAAAKAATDYARRADRLWREAADG